MFTEVQGYTHLQPVASDKWVIVHGLNCKPIVQIYAMLDGKLERMLPKSIVADSAHQVTVSFTMPFSGHAVLL